MTAYILTTDAEQDLRDVVRYSLNKWNQAIYNRYKAGLKSAFEQIGTGKAAARRFSKNYLDLYVSKYRYHYIFYIKDTGATPIIIGVIHEKRDIVARLKERLE